MASAWHPLGADGWPGVAFGSVGLGGAVFKSGDTPPAWIPHGGEPYYAAEGVVAISPRLPADAIEPARLKARRFDPGSVVVELKDAAGRPARGVVEVIQGEEPDLMGTNHRTGVVPLYRV